MVFKSLRGTLVSFYFKTVASSSLLRQTYFSTASALHSQEMKDLFNVYAAQVKKATDEEAEMST